MNRMKTTGIILAGGKSSRMGQEKGLIVLNNKILIQHVIDAVSPLVSQIIIIANSNHYDNLGYRVFSDLVAPCGPIGGIYTGLMNSNTKDNFVLSCDIPFISTKMLQYILKHSDNTDIALPIHNNVPEPLCAYYSKQCTGMLKQLIDLKEWKMNVAINSFDTKRIDVSTQENFHENFINLNTPFELNTQTKFYGKY